MTSLHWLFGCLVNQICSRAKKSMMFFCFLLLLSHALQTKAFSGEPFFVSDATQSTQFQKNKTNILIMGDSLSAAYDMPAEEGWVALLLARLQDACKHTVIHNRSISGETTGGGLHRLPAALQSIRPDLVVIELGANDGLQGISIDKIRENLGEMIQQSRATGADVLIAGVRIPPRHGAAYSKRFSNMYFSLKDTFGVPLVPYILEGIADNPALLQEDGMHPSSQAQSRVLDNVWPQLQTFLPCASER